MVDDGQRRDAGAVVAPPNFATLNSELFHPLLADEVILFEAAYQARLPMLLKGSTGCDNRIKLPLQTEL